MGNLVLDGDPTAPLKPITEYPTPLGDYLAAKAGEAVQSSNDMYSYILGSRPDNTLLDDTSSNVYVNPYVSSLPGIPIYGKDSSQDMLDSATAQKRLTDAGVKLKAPESGMYANTLDALIDRHQEQAARQVAIAGSPTGLRSALGIGVQFATAMFDPLNIASAFVPVIGPAKYTALLAEASGPLARLGIRAGVGAGEGAVGTALLQPLAGMAARNVGDDFTMTNALENIGFGAVFGAGLHSIGGAVKDVFSGAPTKPSIATDIPDVAPDIPLRGVEAPAVAERPIVIHLETGDVPVSQMGAAWINNSVSHETRIAATSTAVSQVLDGRGVTIEPLLRADPALQYAMAARQQPTDMAMALNQARADVAPEIRAELTAQASNAAEPGAISEMRSQIAEIRSQLESMSAAPEKADVRALQQSQKLKFSDAQARAQVEHDARRAELEQTAATLDQQIETNRAAAQAQQDLAAMDRGEFPERFQDRAQQQAEKLLQDDPIQSAVRRLFDPSPDADRAAAQRFNSSDNVAVANSEMARAADIHLSETPDSIKEAGVDGAELSMKAAEEKYRMTLDQLKESGATDKTLESFASDLEPFDADIKDAEALGKGILGAALCGVNR